MTETEEKSSKWKEMVEIIAVSAYLFLVLGMNQITLLLMIYLSYTSKIGMCLVLLAITWIFSDRNIHETGGRRQYFGWSGFRDLAWWRYYRTYFPVTLHKTAEVPPDRNYLLGIFPHGVISAGTYSAFGTNSHKLDNLFPGLTFYLATLKVLFYLPILRELLLMSGIVSATQKSLMWLLGSPGVGRATALVVGGAAEAYHNEAGVYKILLKQRKGFCKIALQTGASLVPVLALGEVDLYEVSKVAPGTWFYRAQQWVKNTTGVLPVTFKGTGWWGLLPRRRPINVIVGAPIHTEKKTEVTERQVDELHEKFTSSLVKLFEENRQYLANPNTQLQFV